MPSQSKQGDKWFKGLVSGSEINRYVLDYAGNYLHIDRKLLWSGGWDPEIILKDKILLRQTGDSLHTTLDREKYYHLNNVHSIALKDKRYDLRYILAIINSKMMNHYYHLISLELGRVMAQTDIETIEELPIRRIDFFDSKEIELQSELVKLVEKVLDLNKQRTLLLQTFHEVIKEFNQDTRRIYFF